MSPVENSFEVATFSPAESIIFEQIIHDLDQQKYHIADAFFSNAEAQQLRNHILQIYQQHDFHAAAIGNAQQEQIIQSIRGDRILWIDEKLSNDIEKMFFSKVNRLVQYLNQTCYMGIVESEFHYAVYGAGAFYQKHVDAFQNDDRRTLSMVLYLNDEDWQNEFGGQLTLYVPDETGQEQALDVLPLLGRLAIFNSKTIPHEVKTVQHTRYSITGWLKTRPMSLHI